MHLTSRRRRAAAGVLPALALAAALAAALVHPASAGPREPGAAPLAHPDRAAATWAASRLTDGTHASGDHGLTADIVIALASTGTGGSTASKATDWLATHADTYISKGVSGNVSAGATAKLALVAAVEHRDAEDFGGVDLVATLLERLQDNGRFTDRTGSADLSNQFSQSLAVLALDRAGAVPDKAVDFLAKSRCSDGGYPLTFRSDPAKCTSDVDSTGLAVQALLAVDRKADTTPALDWLESRQNTDGGFAYGGPGNEANSNTTALAVQALAAGDRGTAADKGTAWLGTVQLGCAAPAADRGAVGYMKPVADGSALRATAQVIPALAGKSLGEVDSSGSAPDLTEITCAPGGDDSGGASGGSTDGGTSTGGGDGGSSTGGDSAGSAGGTDPSATPDPTAGVTGGTGGTSGAVSGGPAPADGALASTGSPVLPLAAAAGALLLLGTASVAVVRPRHRRT